MATNLPSLDIDYVKQFCDTDLPDSVIQGEIDWLDENYGECLFSKYGDIKGSNAASVAICWTLGSASGGTSNVSGNITNLTDSEGASVSYDQSISEVDKRLPAQRLDPLGCLDTYYNRDEIIFETLNGACSPYGNNS